MASTLGQTDQPITIGILGSGQLGRMIAIAAAQLGLRAHIYAPDANSSPAGDIAYATTTAAYDDDDALATFAQSIDVVTSEFENVPKPPCTPHKTEFAKRHWRASWALIRPASGM